MDVNRLKKFAQSARRILKEGVREKIAFVLQEGSIARRENAKAVSTLEEQIQANGLEAVVDAVAYTWFNRFCALRYMDVMGYNPVRVVSPYPGHFQPEILEEAKAGNIDESVRSTNTRDLIAGLLNGTIKQTDAQTLAYKHLLVSYCNLCSSSMPFLFQAISDYTGLLLPDDLLGPRSIFVSLREAIPEDASEHGVELIGWLYQFYISEHKDEVINKVVSTEDIPAATQLFTPDWVVRYLVENTLGTLWSINHPESRLTEGLEYFIKQQEPGITPAPSSLSPTEIRFCDPCCGSGHILVYAFDILYRIYEEAGYSPQDIPSLILQNNLFGVEIDERAGQLAAFALSMKARSYDSRFLRRKNAPKPQICVLQNITFAGDQLSDYMHLANQNFYILPLETALMAFEQAKCFGSLIVPEIPDAASFLKDLNSKKAMELLGTSETHKRVLQVLKQSDFLSRKYDIVVTNPPYMGTKGMNPDLKKFAEKRYPDSKSDLFAMFMERCPLLAHKGGLIGMITMQSWMFLSSFERLRLKILDENTLLTMAHLGPRAFDTIGGEVVQTTAFTFTNHHIPAYSATFVRVVDGNSEAEKAEMFKEAIH